eukprot:CAMPEP_0183411056 /NCGR_PEP_ID=MMETSP0370-20130417/20034_1 /TAXON_ID=268820 /ORGANISM="Peridinium aciculiferum, Strain PAER-2" /LENGTH=231 /DNA_ID=CAMNT_0025593977 /DNA_START=14 /DNA_END=709 /DNA_ORIENTATION=+
MELEMTKQCSGVGRLDLRFRASHRVLGVFFLIVLPCAASGTYVADLRLHGAQGISRTYQGKPAIWNSFLPNFGKPKLSYQVPNDRESYNVQPSFYGRVIIDPWNTAGNRSLACVPLGSAPPQEAVAVLVERGLCSFRQKALMAYQAGYSAVIVANTMPGYGNVPDMTAEPEFANANMEVPAWALTQADGQELRLWLVSDNSIRLEVEDVPRWPAFGYNQEDVFGLRVVVRI